MFNVSFDNSCYLLHCPHNSVCLLWYIKKIKELFLSELEKHILKSISF